jgi:hypothetical protein
VRAAATIRKALLEQQKQGTVFDSRRNLLNQCTPFKEENKNNM